MVVSERMPVSAPARRLDDVRRRALGPLIFVVTFVLADGLGAHLGRGMLDAHAIAVRAATEARMRSARRPVAAYHHDLVPLRDVEQVWGSRRYRLRTNSLGFRDAATREVPLRPHAGRLLILGDSFAEGVGVAYPDTLAGRLAASLAPRGVEVLDAGVVSYAPLIHWRKLAWLLERGLELNRLLVLVDVSDAYDEALQYTLDARQDVVWRCELDAVRERLMIDTLLRRHARIVLRRLAESRFPEFKRDYPAIAACPSVFARAEQALPDGLRLRRFFAEHSLTGALIDAFGARQRDPSAPDTYHAGRALWTHDADLYRRYGARGATLMTAHMDRLLALARTHALGLTLVIYPWPHQLHRDPERDRYRALWRRWSGERSVPLIDLYPAFLRAGPPDATVRSHFIAGDVHWNEHGHALAAQAVLHALH